VAGANAIAALCAIPLTISLFLPVAAVSPRVTAALRRRSPRLRRSVDIRITPSNELMEACVSRPLVALSRAVGVSDVWDGQDARSCSAAVVTMFRMLQPALWQGSLLVGGLGPIPLVVGFLLVSRN